MLVCFSLTVRTPIVCPHCLGNSSSSSNSGDDDDDDDDDALLEL